MPQKISPRKSFVHFIAEHRESRDMTQPELAKKLGCDVMTVSRWENYKTRVDMPILEAVAEALGSDLRGEDLLHHPDDPTPNRLLRQLPQDDQKYFIKQLKNAAKQG